MVIKISRLILAIILTIPFTLWVGWRPVQAQTVSALQVIQAVNEVRAASGLEPYQVDGEWMAVAQAQSEYQASIGKLTHLRADGTGPGDHSISSENIGGGYSISAQMLINQWTDDYWHHFTLVGFDSGLVGAGVAQDSDGYYYYTLVVKNTGKLSGYPNNLVTPEAGVTAPAFEDPALPIFTATPQKDGSIIHSISSGETLWSISKLYEIPVNDLASLNFLDPANPLIYPGQTLVVRTGYTVTPTPTITGTPLPPTRTLRPSRTPQPSRQAGLGLIAGTDTDVPLIPAGSVINRNNINNLGTISILLGAAGLVVLIFGRLWTRRNSRRTGV